jgi:hypothetical protein
MRNVLLMAALLAMLAGAVIFAYSGFSEGGDTSIGIHERIAMFLGIRFSITCGVGLMSLVFYSSHHGYDEPL